MATVLVLGGTQWVGRQVARAALAAGHEVTCLARGRSGEPDPGVRFVSADRMTPDGYAGVARDWDLVVDVSWQPAQVRSALDALSGRAGRWAYVSSGSVYADHSRHGADEGAAVLPAFDGDVAGQPDYGHAKVACELLCRAALDDRLLIARAGLICGRGDTSDRFGYWPARFAAGTSWGSPSVLVPDADDQPTQPVHVDDLARWLVAAPLAGVTGALDAVGERTTLGAVLAAARRVAGFDGAVLAAPTPWLAAQGVEGYMGERSLPLWLADPDWAAFNDRDGGAARAAGLTHRPLADLVDDALRWERELGLLRARKAGLTGPQERALIDAWATRSP